MRKRGKNSASDEATFSTVRRGWDPAEVNAALDKLRSERDALVAKLVNQLLDTEDVPPEVRHAAADGENPDDVYAEAGNEVAAVLRAAQVAAAHIREDAARDAQERQQTAEARAEQTISAAEQRSAEMIAQAEQRLAQARVEADGLVRDAVVQSREILDGALAQVDRLREGTTSLQTQLQEQQTALHDSIAALPEPPELPADEQADEDVAESADGEAEQVDVEHVEGRDGGEGESAGLTAADGPADGTAAGVLENDSHRDDSGATDGGDTDSSATDSGATDDDTDDGDTDGDTDGDIVPFEDEDDEVVAEDRDHARHGEDTELGEDAGMAESEAVHRIVTSAPRRRRGIRTDARMAHG